MGSLTVKKVLEDQLPVAYVAKFTFDRTSRQIGRYTAEDTHTRVVRVQMEEAHARSRRWLQFSVPFLFPWHGHTTPPAFCCVRALGGGTRTAAPAADGNSQTQTRRKDMNMLFRLCAEFEPRVSGAACQAPAPGPPTQRPAYTTSPTSRNGGTALRLRVAELERDLRPLSARTRTPSAVSFARLSH